MSAAIVYGENGQIERIVQIRECLSDFPDESSRLKSLDILVDWVGNKRTMTSDLSISPEEKIHLSFREGDHKTMLLPEGLALMLPEQVPIAQPIQIAAAQFMANHQVNYLAADYTADGAFTSLTAATLQPQSQS